MTRDETQVPGEAVHGTEVSDDELDGVDGGIAPFDPLPLGPSGPSAPSEPAGGGQGICC